MASSCRGHSKAQTCFFKILNIISSTPPIKQEPFPSNTTKGISIDLNLTFSESESSRSDGNINEEQGFEEKSVVDVSEKVDNSNEDGNENAETASFRGGDSSNNNNCLDLLIEAARVLSKKDEDESDSDESRSRREKRKERWVVVDLYGGVVAERHTEPVVRSKRGRSQTLPYRFRDSVVEPLKRATRSQRPSSTAQLSKRLLRSDPTT